MKKMRFRFATPMTAMNFAELCRANLRQICLS